MNDKQLWRLECLTRWPTHDCFSPYHV